MITIQTDGLKQKLAELASVLPAEFSDATKATAESSKVFVQSGSYWTNRTGRTSRSFRVVKSGSTGHAVVSSSPVAAMLRDGTRAHVIEAKPGSTLRFVQNGQLRFAKRVQHPGTKPTNFEAREATRAAPDLAMNVAKAAANAVAKAGLA